MTLLGLDLDVPIVAAPMAGGPTTPALVAAARRAGGLGFLAAGYKSAAMVADDIAATRDLCDVFGVNVFSPNPVHVEPTDFARYAAALGIDAGDPVEDDDDFGAKLAILVDDPVPWVSFTFGLPPADAVRRLQTAGTAVIQTVTSAEETVAADELGVDGLVVQAAAAGAHSGIFDARRNPPEIAIGELLDAVRSRTSLPLLAAGGLATSTDVAAVLASGAAAAMVGTVLVRTDESGANEVYKAALADPLRTETVLTRAFTGRPARALRNAFVDAYTSQAPTGYPAVHHLTRAMRAEAVAAGDAEHVNIWAGQGWRHAATGPAHAVIASLAGGSSYARPS